ncbi:MAG: SDR family oxidoreductase [Rhodospirillales bacterium]|nr:SDR family oxidoreductase [Rhodospirillales bacterium]MBN8905837.1 SDR family oxidoreductase [Rhodospirillales bacterium]MBN8925080.1 SDR family oxidoreductase [Rhodospirillales bacterium]
MELKHGRIRVNVLSPGPTNTPLIAKLVIPSEMLPAVEAQVARAMPFGRLAEAGDLARAAVFLASSDGPSSAAPISWLMAAPAWRESVLRWISIRCSLRRAVVTCLQPRPWVRKRVALATGSPSAASTERDGDVVRGDRNNERRTHAGGHDG